jgi:formylglycine-generating enzyme
MRLIALFVVALLPCARAFATITIETVPVGDVGNPIDTGAFNLWGPVSYAYNIGKYEITVGQYLAFLNAVAATDTYNLYSTLMGSNANVAGISRNCTSGCTYSLIGSANHPITSVSWGDAARFANWIQNGQPSGAEGPGTTETGAYSLNGATTNSALMAVSRNTGASWFIPTENEWYKAAYYQPAAQGGDSDSYWDYPMRTNSAPYSDQPPGATPDNTRVANFFYTDGISNGYNDGYAVTGSISLSGSQNYLTNVGAYTSSSSYYGTFDQGGNVYEWNDTVTGSSTRCVRGGSWAVPDFASLRSWNQNRESPVNEHTDVGFRLVFIIPEPSTAALIGSAAVPLFNTGRRRRCPI